MTEIDPLEQVLDAVGGVDTLRYLGRVTRVVGMLVEGVMPQARIGSTCQLQPPNAPTVLAEVVGIKDGVVQLMPLGSLHGLTSGTRIVMTEDQTALKVGPGCLGRVLDGLGHPIDGRGPLTDVENYPLMARPLNPLARRTINRSMDLGVRSINGLLTIGEGQRIAVVAGAGVGKSTLLGMMARHTKADVAVVALIGERGREVQEFVEHELQLSKIDASRIIVVAATSDESPALRIRAAFTATAISEYFRDSGKSVLLMMDSLTRVVMAQRQVGLSVGEPPATRGYPPSAFAVIPNLLERAGINHKGSITAIYTTLIESDDFQDPVGDAVRATSDGHIMLSRDLAEGGQFPAVDVVKSVSRVMRQVTSPEHLEAAQAFRTLLHDYEAVQDLVNLGAYRRGSNAQYDRALQLAPKLQEYLKQGPDDGVSLEDSINALKRLVSSAHEQASSPKSVQREAPSQNTSE